MISPLLANIFLHHVLDECFVEVAQPRLSGRTQLVRYADDFVIPLEDPESGKRMLGVLGRRLAKYGLTLHVDKTHYVDFRPHRLKGLQHPATDATTFNFLGFTHVWGRSRKGNRVVRQVTAKDRYARSLKAIWRWCKTYRHLTLKQQHEYLVR
ncbi:MULTISPECIES: reverse transcriptase domain-containing protein [unclassified Mesorhizobium]|uniref:reverse transcriptase domain-containing protein n=1 Tax=unclassified Mesorhizobium TaxID=325217 RepID=UPI001FE0C5CE|nr:MULTISPECIES: reverse transcriptase domain-containing protein [unclassified Mesorhizobium]